MRIKRLCVISCMLLLASACGSPLTPSATLIGAWEFSFSVFGQQVCPTTPGLMPGCAGSGQFDFLSTRPLSVRHSYRASCQSCGGAAEYGVFDQVLSSARLRGEVLEFALASCQFTATVPEMRTATIDGSVVCRPVAQEPEVRGSWTMSRR